MKAHFEVLTAPAVTHEPDPASEIGVTFPEIKPNGMQHRLDDLVEAAKAIDISC